MREYFRANHPEILEAIRSTGNLPETAAIDEGTAGLHRRVRRRLGRLSGLIDGRRSGTGPAAADPHRPVDQEDHPGDGAHRRVADRPGPGLGSRPTGRSGRAWLGSSSRRRSATPRPPPSCSGRPESPRSVAVLAVVSDRGLCGPYNSSILRTTERLVQDLRSREAEPRIFVVGRRGPPYLRFRGIEVEQAFTGFTDRPTFADARRVSAAVSAPFRARRGGPAADGVHSLSSLPASSGCRPSSCCRSRTRRRCRRSPR